MLQMMKVLQRYITQYVLVTMILLHFSSNLVVMSTPQTVMAGKNLKIFAKYLRL